MLGHDGSLAVSPHRQTSRPTHHSWNDKTRFQSFFMPTTNQPSLSATSYIACEKVPTLLSGRPVAGR